MMAETTGTIEAVSMGGPVVVVEDYSLGSADEQKEEHHLQEGEHQQPPPPTRQEEASHPSAPVPQIVSIPLLPVSSMIVELTRIR
jgi:hypothetical protein